MGKGWAAEPIVEWGRGDDDLVNPPSQTHKKLISFQSKKNLSLTEFGYSLRFSAFYLKLFRDAGLLQWFVKSAILKPKYRCLENCKEMIKYTLSSLFHTSKTFREKLCRLGCVT